MLVKDIFHNFEIGIEPIRMHCTRFINESCGLPMVKYLPQVYQDIQKVKVRKRKHTNEFSNAFNGAFENELRDLRERSIFTNGSNTKCVTENSERFYVFPINGYKFLYSKEVDNSNTSYTSVLESILNQFGESGKDVFSDLLRFSYMTEHLSEGIQSGAEIIIYGIPYYYAIRESYVDNYTELLTVLK